MNARSAIAAENEFLIPFYPFSSNGIYFSTDSMFYALKDNSAEIISDKFGGVLKFFDNGLIIFNPDKKLLIRMVGLSEKNGVGE